MDNRSRPRDDPDVRITRQVLKTQHDKCVKGLNVKHTGTQGNFSRKIKIVGNNENEMRNTIRIKWDFNSLGTVEKKLNFIIGQQKLLKLKHKGKNSEKWIRASDICGTQSSNVCVWSSRRRRERTWAEGKCEEITARNLPKLVGNTSSQNQRMVTSSILYWSKNSQVEDTTPPLDGRDTGHIAESTQDGKYCIFGK